AAAPDGRLGGNRPSCKLLGFCLCRLIPVPACRVPCRAARFHPHMYVSARGLSGSPRRRPYPVSGASSLVDRARRAWYQVLNFLGATAGICGMSSDTGQAPTVFIVDDDRSILRAMQFLLESVGLASEVFASGEEFLAGFDP